MHRALGLLSSFILGPGRDHNTFILTRAFELKLEPSPARAQFDSKLSEVKNSNNFDARKNFENVHKLETYSVACPLISYKAVNFAVKILAVKS